MSANKKLANNKKGISELISYVLLITLAIAMAAAAWFFLKPYAERPLAGEECPETVNLVLENYECNLAEKTFTFTLKNRGLHNITGVRLKIISYGQELEKDSLLFIPDCTGMGSDCVACDKAHCFGIDEESAEQTIDYSSYGNIKQLAIYPIRIDEQGEIQLCSNAVIKVPVVGCTGTGGSGSTS